MTLMEPRGDEEEDDEIILEKGIKMEKEMKCAICGSEIPIERDETGLIILSSLVCLKCNRLRCPRCGYPVVIEHLYDGVPVRLRCISAQCGFLKKILV